MLRKPKSKFPQSCVVGDLIIAKTKCYNRQNQIKLKQQTMLKALKIQLIEMAKDSSGSFAMEIEKRIGTVNSPQYISELRNFILVVPDMIAQIRAWSDDPIMPSELRNIHGFLLTYLFHPDDFLNCETHGLLGYLDDTYFVGIVYEATKNESDYTSRHYLPNHEDLSGQIHCWLEKAREIMPEETTKIDQMMDDLRQGNMGSFWSLFRPSASGVHSDGMRIPEN